MVGPPQVLLHSSARDSLTFDSAVPLHERAIGSQRQIHRRSWSSLEPQQGSCRAMHIVTLAHVSVLMQHLSQSWEKTGASWACIGIPSSHGRRFCLHPTRGASHYNTLSHVFCTNFALISRQLPDTGTQPLTFLPGGWILSEHVGFYPTTKCSLYLVRQELTNAHS